MATSRSSFRAVSAFRLHELKASLGVETVLTHNLGATYFDLRSRRGEHLGSMQIKVGTVFYHVYSINVEPFVRGRGLGRLLQIEAALHAHECGISYKFPSMFFLPMGRERFRLYPISTKDLVQGKLDRAFDKIGNS